MAPFVVNEAAVHEFKTLAALHRWYKANHAKAPEMWIKIHKKGSGLPSVTNVEGFEEALCWGWVDTQTKGIDESRYSIRFRKRRPGSNWSAINRTILCRLIANGRMQPAGRAVMPADLTCPD